MAFTIQSHTDTEEILEFMRERLDEPIVREGKLTYNLNSHDVDWQALQVAMEEKDQTQVFVIPYQVTSVWGLMYQLLPEDLKREADLLIYSTDTNEYRAFDTRHSDVPPEHRLEMKDAFAQLHDSNLDLTDPR